MIERYRKIQRQRAAGELDASGFTLIELLIVIVVLGILAAVVVFALGGVAGQSAQAACNADAKTVETALAAYNAQVGSFPSAGTTGESQLLTTASVGGNTDGPWLQSWPNNSGTNYTITLAANGVVDVQVGTATATAYSASACNGATT